MTSFRRFLAALLILFLLTFSRAFAQTPPNVILIFCDDMGYGDIHPFGSANPTPNLDRMASEGMKFTDFYVGQPICTASRAALMTGCYPNRVGLLGAIGPSSKIGINSNEFIMPKMFKSRSYATGMVGKWHLGDSTQFLPTHNGFDEYFGLPYSNDMRKKDIGLPLIEGDKVIDRNPDLHMLTTWYTERAIKFIDSHKDKPFFFYVAHSMPHVPIAVSEKNAGKGGRGLYSDVIYEIDWSVGQILDALKKNDLDEKTLVVFTSDNGPWLLYGNHAGSAGPLREGKMTSFDGGMREPCIMRWPGHVPAGATCPQLASSMDLLPTFAALAGAQLPTDRVIDGKDIRPLMLAEQNAKTPHDVYYFYWGKELQAVRSGKWKMHVAHPYLHLEVPGVDGKPGKTSRQELAASLFDMDTDKSELHNVAAEHPDVIAELTKLAEQAREDLGDQNRIGKNVRLPGKRPDATSTSQPQADLSINVD